MLYFLGTICLVRDSEKCPWKCKYFQGHIFVNPNRFIRLLCANDRFGLMCHCLRVGTGGTVGFSLRFAIGLVEASFRPRWR